MVTKKIYKTREEWLTNRTSCIGGSDAACILGLNPYKTNQQLFLEKTGQAKADDISDKDCVVYGTKAEEHLRALFALDFPQYEVLYEENNMWTNDNYPFAHASLDGWLVDKTTGRKAILEIKTSTITNSQGWEKWKNKIPTNYYCQILHYFMVTEFDFAILKAKLIYQFDTMPNMQIRHYFIERSEVENDIKHLIEHEINFAQRISTGSKPDLILPTI